MFVDDITTKSDVIKVRTMARNGHSYGYIIQMTPKNDNGDETLHLPAQNKR